MSYLSPLLERHRRAPSRRSTLCQGLRIATLLLACLQTPPVCAAHLAGQLIITEVAFDTTDESTLPSSEYLEIFNPTDATVSLNAGAEPGKATSLGSWFLADFFKSTNGSASTYYYQVVKGRVPVNTTGDGVFQFPQGATIPPRGTVVVTSSSEKFLAEFFGTASSLAAFKALPGKPQLFETTQDGAADGVPDMLVQSEYSSGVGNLSLSNGGELLVLFYWDGRSDLIKDGDLVVWKPTAPAPELVTKKSTDAIDGPDSDFVSSYFPATDAAPSDSLLLAQPASPTNAWSAQRKNMEEPLETDTGGNGLQGHDETAERWGLLPGDQSPNPSWVYERFTPGVPLLLLDGKVSDALSFLKPAAVSSADGSLGASAPQDYGADGTLTELYLWPVDSPTDQDYVPDALYVAVRGELFGSSDSANASLVLLDLDPGKGTGVRRLDAVGADLSDTTGALDTRITRARFVLDGALASGFGMDAAFGVDALSVTTDTAGWRTWGTGGSSGGVSDFAYGSTLDAAAGGVSSLYPGATGTRLAGQDGLEGLRPFTALSTTSLTYLLAAAVTTTDNGSGASPNTLPETAQDDLQAAPQKLVLGVCIELSTGSSILRYVDADGDGVGSTQYCGPGSAGSSSSGGDCNDGDGTQAPGKAEVCDGKDNNCNGETDEGVRSVYYADADGDGYGTSVVTSTGCSLPAGYSILAGDCDDEDPDLNPGELEVCDGLDNNCAGGVDDGLPSFTWYADQDGDGYGGGDSQGGCQVPPGAASTGGDCQEEDPAVHPGASEVCDGQDNNCSGTVDEGLLQTWYPDLDGDGVGAGSPVQACTAPPGTVALSGDCNDSQPSVSPQAAEVCDGQDNNCNDISDEGVTVLLYVDGDGDGFGAAGSVSTEGCPGTPGRASNSLDCQDESASIYPGALELCDGLDNDCDPLTDETTDGDEDGLSPCSGDCNDQDTQVVPGALELCNEGQDDDCDPFTDEQGDADGDGASLCEGDCDEGDPAVGPDGPETACDDALDNDCDAQVDLNDLDCTEEATPSPLPSSPTGQPTGTPEQTPVPLSPTPGAPTPSLTPTRSPTQPLETPQISPSPTETAFPPGTASLTPSGTPPAPTPTMDPAHSPRPTLEPTSTPTGTPAAQTSPTEPGAASPSPAPTGTPEHLETPTPEPAGGGCGCQTTTGPSDAGGLLLLLGLLLSTHRGRGAWPQSREP